MGHRFRIEIRAILNEGVHTRKELADLIGTNPDKLKHHITELLADGSIEIARTERVGNMLQHYYRATTLPFFSDEEIAAMPPRIRQATIGVFLEAAVAEALASFWAGKMVDDPRVWLSWRWFNVDAKGRKDIADEQARSWARVMEIEAESTARCIESNESPASLIVTSLGYPRSRTSLTPPTTMSDPTRARVRPSFRFGKGGRCIEDAIAFAVGHQIRIEVLALLNEAVRSPEELARLIDCSLGQVSHHIHELLDDGSIELAHVVTVRNTVQHYYRATKLPFFTDEEIAAMPPRIKQATIGVCLQAVIAEAMAAFWAGKMVDDPRVWLSWRWFNVDAKGRKDIADEQARSWARVMEIEAESTARCIESKESATSLIVTFLSYPRSRTALSSLATSPGAEILTREQSPPWG